MSRRKVHLRPNTVINVNRTKTACGFPLMCSATDPDAAVGDYGCFDATIHGTLVTCLSCLRKMQSRISSNLLLQTD